ncbi:MAG: hypothetical protein KJO31_17530 [Gammaproteobacteria bacterium]|nr:hypothetical protein [Gammaproteobacteria bacterium]
MNRITIALLGLILLPGMAVADSGKPFHALFYTSFEINGIVPPGTAPCGDVDFPPEAGPECLVTIVSGAGHVKKMGFSRIDLSDVIIFNDGPPKATSNYIQITADTGPQDALFLEYVDLPAPFDAERNAAIIEGPVKIVGGIGRFAGAHGIVHMHVAAFLNNNTAIIRFRGRVGVRNDD